MCLVSAGKDLRIAYVSDVAAPLPADISEHHKRRWEMDPPTRLEYIKRYDTKTHAMITWTDQHILVLDPYLGAPGRLDEDPVEHPDRMDVIGTPLFLNQTVVYKSTFFNIRGQATVNGGLVLGTIVEFGPRGGVKIARRLEEDKLGTPKHVSKFLVLDEPRLRDRIIKYRLAS